MRSRSLSFFIIGFILALISSCELLNYTYTPPEPTFEEKQELILSDSINNYIRSNFISIYTPLSFGSLSSSKPDQFIALDSLYLLQRKIANLNSIPEEITKNKQEITAIKKEINSKKLYHTNSLDHLYLLKDSANLITLFENRFIFLPNNKLKDVTTLFSTFLSNEEEDLLRYFLNQSPLYETNDYYHDKEMNKATYERFHTAISNETTRKAELIHTILFCVKYIRAYNNFNTRRIAIGLAENRITKKNISNFKGDFEGLKETTTQAGYSIKATNQNKSKINSIKFEFDLNLVITNITIE